VIASKKEYVIIALERQVYLGRTVIVLFFSSNNALILFSEPDNQSPIRRWGIASGAAVIIIMEGGGGTNSSFCLILRFSQDHTHWQAEHSTAVSCLPLLCFPIIQYLKVNVIIAWRTGRKAGQTQFHPRHPTRDFNFISINGIL
jgi:hypothetical protein